MGDSAERGRVTRAIGLMLEPVLARWATPGAGRVAICSPAVGMIAGPIVGGI